MTHRRRRSESPPEPNTDSPATRPVILRRLLLYAGLVLALLTGQSAIAPLLIGWSRAEDLIALDDRMAALCKEQERLERDIEYRKTEAGKKLAALETVKATDAGGRLIELTPKAPDIDADPKPSLGRHIEGLRKKGHAAFYRKWRVLSLYLLDRRLPPLEAS